MIGPDNLMGYFDRGAAHARKASQSRADRQGGNSTILAIDAASQLHRQLAGVLSERHLGIGSGNRRPVHDSIELTQPSIPPVVTNAGENSAQRYNPREIAKHHKDKQNS